MKDARKILTMRYVLCLFVVLAFAIVTIFRIVRIQYGIGEFWAGKIEELENSTEVIPGLRGSICARDGRAMAISVPRYELRLDLSLSKKYGTFYNNVDSLALMLSKTFPDKSKYQFKNELKKAYRLGNKFHLIHRRKVSYTELQYIKTFPLLRDGRFKGGFIAKNEDVRLLSFGQLAASTIGRINHGVFGGKQGGIGLSGFEGLYEPYLKGQDGLMVRQNFSGTSVSVVEEEPKVGMNLISTLDIDMQDIAHNALLKQLRSCRGHHGTAIVMEVETGKVRAIANLELGKDLKYSEAYNYAIGHNGNTEPGSTFKLMTLMAALESGRVDIDDTFDLGDGSWQVYDRTVYDSDYAYGEHGVTSVQRIFEKSSNVGFAKMITSCFENDREEFIERLVNIGVTEPLGLGIKGEAKTYLKDPSDKKMWWGTTLAWMSYGYEVTMSPMQVLMIYNAVANNGKMMRPLMVNSIQESGKIVKEFEPDVVKNRICSRETIRKAKAALLGAVENGTGRALKTDQYKFSGKTGTAQVAQSNRGYITSGKKKYQSSFAGYFPAEKPKYSCIVVINDPSQGKIYGGQIAGPVFREIADYIMATDLTIELPEQNDPITTGGEPFIASGLSTGLETICDELDIDADGTAGDERFVHDIKAESIQLRGAPVTSGTMPDLMDMGASEAVFAVEKTGAKASVKGFGFVAEQFPLAGEKIRKGQTVYIRLSL